MLDSFEDQRLTPSQLLFVPAPGVKNASADPNIVITTIKLFINSKNKRFEIQSGEIIVESNAELHIRDSINSKIQLKFIS